MAPSLPLRGYLSCACLAGGGSQGHAQPGPTGLGDVEEYGQDGVSDDGVPGAGGMEPVGREQGRVGGERARGAFLRVRDVSARRLDRGHLPAAQGVAGGADGIAQEDWDVRHGAEVRRWSNHDFRSGGA